MTKLTDTQLVLLSAASLHAEGIIPITERLKGGAANAVATKLIAMGLAEERSVASPLMGWRENADGQRVELVITAKGLAAIGVEDWDGHGHDPIDPAIVLTSDAPATPEKAPQAANESAFTPASAPADVQSPNRDGDRPFGAPSRAGTKKSIVIAALQQDGGASIDEIAALTNWQPHTTRAFLTGLRKVGMSIAMVRQSGSATRYRIVAPADGVEA